MGPSRCINTFRQLADDDVNGLFKVSLMSSGFNLHLTAVLAPTCEGLVHTYCVERLRTAYRMLGLSVGAQMSQNEANVIIKAYIVMYVQGNEPLDISVAGVQGYSGGDQHLLPYMSRY